MKLAKGLLSLGKSFHNAVRKPANQLDVKKRSLKYVIGAGFVAAPAISYFSLDDKKKRQIHVNIGGIERSLRFEHVRNSCKMINTP